jgi:hypothetical protein
MADQNPQVSDPTGEPELPTPSFSEPGASSPSVSADEIVSKLLAQLKPEVEKMVQSTKDKRISKIEKALGGRDDLLAELEAEGVTVPKEVRAEMRIRELEERLNGQQAQPVPSSVDGSTQQRTATTEAIATLSKYNLSPNDPAFIELLRGQYPNRDAFDKAVLGHVVGKLAPQPPASPAGVVQAPATTPARDDVAGKIARLQELQKAPSKYRAEISQLTKELDAANWGGLT